MQKIIGIFLTYVLATASILCPIVEAQVINTGSRRTVFVPSAPIITFVNANSNTSGSTGQSSIATTLTGGSVGDLIVCSVYGANSVNVAGISVSDGTNTMIPMVEPNVTGTKKYYGEMFYLLSATGGGKTYTATFGASDSPRISCMDFHSTSGTWKWDGGNGAAGNNTSSLDTGAATTHVATGVAVLMSNLFQNAATVSNPLINGITPTDPGTGDYYAIQSSTFSNGHGTLTYSATTFWIGLLGVFYVDNTTFPSFALSGGNIVGTSGTVASITLTATSGQLAVVFCISAANGSTFTVTSSPSNTYVASPSGSNTAMTNGSSEMFYSFGIASGSTTFTCTVGVATSVGIAVVLYNAGFLTTLDTSGIKQSSSNSQTQNTNNFTTTAKGLIVMCDYITGSQTSGPNMGVIGVFTGIRRFNNFTSGCGDITYTYANTAIAGNMSSSVFGHWSTAILAFK